MLRTPNFGRKSLNEIKEVLAADGPRISAWRSRAGRRRTSRSWPSGSKSRTEPAAGRQRPGVQQTMRHGIAGRKLSRTSSHRKAMFAQHGGGADQARADHDHAAEGEGAAPDRREADHARQARRPACPPPGLAQLKDDEAGATSCSTALAERYKAAPGRLHPRAEGRLPLRRRGADGGDRAGRPRPRGQGPGRAGPKPRGGREGRDGESDAGAA